VRQRQTAAAIVPVFSSLRANHRAQCRSRCADPLLFVIRYFGSKENLSLASVQFDLRVPDLRKVPSTKRGVRLVRHFLETWEQGNTAAQLPALLRIALSHSNGKAHLETMFREQLEPMLRNVCPMEQASSRAGLICHATLGLPPTRYVLQLSSVVALSEEELVCNVGRTLQAYLS